MGGLKGRHIVAQGVSPGFGIEIRPEPCKGGTKNLNTSVAPVGLKKNSPVNPGLTPWATICRPFRPP